MKPKVVITGSYNIGLVMQTDKLPVWGETALAQGFSEGAGGKGSNQAVAVSRLGGRSYFVGCIGTDIYGDDAIRMLSAEQVDVSYVKRTDLARTGAGFVILNSMGENCILVDPGANLLLRPQDVEQSAAVYDGADIALFQLEMGLDTIEYALKTAVGKGVFTILNPAPAFPDIEALLRHSKIVTPNDSELKILSGVDPSEVMAVNAYVEMARILLEKGPKAIIVTRGEQGATIVQKDNVLHVAAPRVIAVDTTGAGDSFSAALAVAIGERKSLEEAVRLACYAGAYTVTAREVIPALPARKELEIFIQKNLRTE
jgi:ribokinase